MSDLLKESLLRDSEKIRKEAREICNGNKDEMIGVLAMQLAMERRKNANDPTFGDAPTQLWSNKFMVTEITLFDDVEDYVKKGISLSYANLAWVDLENTNLSGADLRNANLCGVNLRNANLSGAKLIGAELTRADLTKADLTRADLSKADLSGADLTRAVK